MIHQNRFMELDRLHMLSGGLTREGEVDALLERMLDFAEAGVFREGGRNARDAFSPLPGEFPSPFF